jgi:hypothetical protein
MIPTREALVSGSGPTTRAGATDRYHTDKPSEGSGTSSDVTGAIFCRVSTKMHGVTRSATPFPY